MTMQKLSLTLDGHQTSLALEPQFWDALNAIAQTRKVSVSTLIAQIDHQRTGQSSNLASAVRLFILDFYVEKSKQ